jgi:hypothetical protein
MGPVFSLGIGVPSRRGAEGTVRLPGCDGALELRSHPPAIAVVKAADPGSSVYGRSCRWMLLHRANQWSVLVDSQMRPVVVVVDPVLMQKALKVVLVENDEVVEQLPPYRTHQALGHPVLPGALVAGPLGGEDHGGRGADHLG